MKREKLDDRGLQKFKEYLLKKREDIIGDVMQIRVSSQEIGRNGIQDTADEAANVYNQEILMSLNESQRRILREVDEALDRIDQGTYGICENCGNPIVIKRLEIRPFARYCVPCQDMIEKQESG